jgi:hypothetical protein
MEIKCDLGYRTRTAYQKKDKNALKALLKEYGIVLRRLRLFEKAFREMWMTDNKPHGFDVQEIRLGGVAARTKSCWKRIADFIEGKTDKIEELEEIYSEDLSPENAEILFFIKFSNMCCLYCISALDKNIGSELYVKI